MHLNSSRVTPLVAAALLFCITLPLAGETRRSRIVFFKYAGAPAGSEGAEHLDAFRFSMRQKLHEFAGSRAIDLPPVAASAPPQANRQAYIDVAEALALVSGVFDSQPQPPHVIISEVYLGDLQGELPQPSVTVVSKFDVTEFRKTRDAFLAASLYALALDELRVHQRSTAAEKASARPVVVRYLAEARNALADAMRMDPQDDELKRLRRAIDAVERAVLSGGRP